MCSLHSLSRTSQAKAARSAVIRIQLSRDGERSRGFSAERREKHIIGANVLIQHYLLENMKCRQCSSRCVDILVVQNKLEQTKWGCRLGCRLQLLMNGTRCPLQTVQLTEVVEEGATGVTRLQTEVVDVDKTRSYSFVDRSRMSVTHAGSYDVVDICRL